MEAYIAQIILSILVLWVGIILKDDRKKQYERDKAFIDALKAMEERANRTDARLQIVEEQCHNQHGTITLGSHDHHGKRGD